jgi:hypothetical protein
MGKKSSRIRRTDCGSTKNAEKALDWVRIAIVPVGDEKDLRGEMEKFVLKSLGLQTVDEGEQIWRREGM